MSDSLIIIFIFGALILGIFAGWAANTEWTANKNKKSMIKESNFPPRIYTQDTVVNYNSSCGSSQAKIINRRGRR